MTPWTGLVPGEGTHTVDATLPPPGDESGTVPEDRRFRPDVEGLRAVAILLVVLFHAHLPGLTGGYVGVDVFFVISGFVITGLLLRERQRSDRTSVLHFYARRSRRILPMATAVIVCTVFAAYLLLGVVTANATADDGRWAALFLANYHFQQTGTNYLTSVLPPSPLQNYWSLAVEEQFYLVFPTLFLVVASAKSRFTLRVRLIAALSVVIVLSFGLSVVQTASNPSAAYFSPFTRAWELALGALVAVCTPVLKRLHTDLATAITWIGLLGIVFAAFAFGPHTAYPGSLVAIPVVGCALVIAGGAAIPRWGAESLLGLAPCRWLGKISYSLYLWHWPILVIATDRVAHLSVSESLLLLVPAVALSVLTYRLVENPIRHWKLPARTSVIAGITLVIATALLLTVVISAETAAVPREHITPAPNIGVVRQQVVAAAHITTVPSNIDPPLTAAGQDWVGQGGGSLQSFYPCTDVPNYEEEFSVCVGGYTAGRHLMVIYGDSHIIMWYPAFAAIARAEHWRLVMLNFVFCPPTLLQVANSQGTGPDTACDKYHRWAIAAINHLHPNLLVVSQNDLYGTPPSHGQPGHFFSIAQWQTGLTKLLNDITAPGVRKVVLGNIPTLTQSGPTCLAAHPNDAQTCSTSVGVATPGFNVAERAAAAASGSQYVDTIPWFCSRICTAIIDHYCVYLNLFHVSSSYAQYLEVVLGRSLGFRAPARAY